MDSMRPAFTCCEKVTFAPPATDEEKDMVLYVHGYNISFANPGSAVFLPPDTNDFLVVAANHTALIDITGPSKVDMP